MILTQGPGPAIREDVQRTVREIQADLQRDIARDARAAAASAREAAAEAAANAQSPPAPPIPPVPVIVGGEEGRHVFVGGSEGAVPPWARRDDIPPQAVEMAMGFFFTMVVIIIGLPIARAFARRMDRKAVPSQIPPELTAQLGQLTQAVDAIALEVERISEGQRFATRLLSEQRQAAHHPLPAGSDR